LTVEFFFLRKKAAANVSPIKEYNCPAEKNQKKDPAKYDISPILVSVIHL
jgi:hypothetical protein